MSGSGKYLVHELFNIASKQYNRHVKVGFREINLLPVRSIKFTFNPFNEKSVSIREFSYFITGRKVIAKNPDAMLKTVVKSDNSSPQMDVVLQDGKKLVYKTENLTTLEILTHLKKFCSANS